MELPVLFFMKDDIRSADRLTVFLPCPADGMTASDADEGLTTSAQRNRMHDIWSGETIFFEKIAGLSVRMDDPAGHAGKGWRGRIVTG